MSISAGVGSSMSATSSGTSAGASGLGVVWRATAGVSI